MAQVADIVAAVRRQFADAGRPAPRILLAGARRQLLELAVAEADTLALPFLLEVGEERLAASIRELRAIAGTRFDGLELALSVLVVGDGEVPEAMRMLVRDVPRDAVSRLSGTPKEIADTLRRRRDQYGISYVTVAQPYIEQFAPVIELLDE